MVKRFEQFYKTRRLDNLGDPEWHNRRWQDIDLRMAAREDDAGKIDDAVDRIEAVALQRLNDTFSPIIQQAMQQLADVGVSFSGQSLTTNTVGLGGKTFTITEAYRVGLVVVDYVSIRPTDVVGVGMICSVTDYDRTTGVLTVTPQAGYITGSGTFSDWQIRVSVTPNLDTYSREEVDGLFTALVGGAPANLNTLGEIAASIGNSATAFTALQGSSCQRSNNLSDILSAASARANIGLGNVDNVADANKPVSAPQQAAMNAIVAGVVPSGTQMIFHQAVVPPGWIRNTSHNDKTIRIVSGTGGVSGGVQPWSSVFGRTNVDYHAVDGNELTYHAHSLYDPGHAHGIADYGHQHADYSANYNFLITDGAYGYAESVYGYYGQYYASWRGYIGGGTHFGWTDVRGINCGIYGAGTGMGVYAAGGSWGHTHGIDLRCQYVDVLIGIKS